MSPEASLPMTPNKAPVRGAALPQGRLKVDQPSSPRGPEALKGSRQTRTGTMVIRAVTSKPESITKSRNVLESKSTLNVKAPASTKTAKKVRQLLISCLNLFNCIISVDDIGSILQLEKPVASLQEPQSKPMASRTSILRETFTKIKNTLPRQKLGKHRL